MISCFAALCHSLAIWVSFTVNNIVYTKASNTPSWHVFALFNNKVIVTVLTIMIKTLKIQWYRIIFLLYGNLKIFWVRNVKRKRNAENTLCPLILTFYNSSVFAVTTVIWKETLQYSLVLSYAYWKYILDFKKLFKQI